MSQTLKAFWQHFRGRGNHGRGFDEAEKLIALKELATVNYVFKHAECKTSLRAKFDVYKESRRNPRLSLRSHPTCFVCQQPARERHHIIALKNGGKNWKKNLVSLCTTCHDEVEGRRVS